MLPARLGNDALQPLPGGRKAFLGFQQNSIQQTRMQLQPPRHAALVFL